MNMPCRRAASWDPTCGKKNMRERVNWSSYYTEEEEMEVGHCWFLIIYTFQCYIAVLEKVLFMLHIM